MLSRSNTNTYQSSVDEPELNDANSSYSVPNLPAGSLSHALEHLRRLVQKRITTWAYLRSAHEGQVFWFNVRRSRLLAGTARSSS